MLKIRKTTRPLERGSRLALLGFIVLFAACGRPEIAPVDIHPEDMCSMCRMAISEKQYAAEFITKDGETVKFDDIGCLRAYLKRQNRDDIAAYYVVDFDSRQWINAEAAYFVHSPEIETPMRGGIAAFKDPSKAEAGAARFHGELLRFAGLPD